MPWIATGTVSLLFWWFELDKAGFYRPAQLLVELPDGKRSKRMYRQIEVLEGN